MTRPPVPNAPPTPMKSAPSAVSSTTVLTLFLNICVTSVSENTGDRRRVFPRGHANPGYPERLGCESVCGSAAAPVVVAGVHVEAGDALGAEHRHVAAVVLEGEGQVETGGPQLPDRRLLEVAGDVVVAPRSGDQQVPADRVAAQPRLGQVRDRCGRAVSSTICSVGIEQRRAACAPPRSPGPRRTPRRTRASPGGATRCSAGGSTRRRARRRCRRRPRAPGPAASAFHVQCSGRYGRARATPRAAATRGTST